MKIKYNVQSVYIFCVNAVSSERGFVECPFNELHIAMPRHEIGNLMEWLFVNSGHEHSPPSLNDF